MAVESGSGLLRAMAAVYQGGVTGGLTDGQLLERCLTRRDEAAEQAFTTLVERHGAMVLGVCRSVLGHSQDAQDAFQATFLVLVLKARGSGCATHSALGSTRSRSAPRGPAARATTAAVAPSRPPPGNGQP